MTAIVINGIPYSDDGSTANDMLNGGHTENFLPLCGEVVTVAGQVAANATAAAASAAEALAAGFKYTYSTTTTMADPGAGIVRFNNATIASVTAIAFDATSADSGNPDVSDYIATFGSSTNTIKGYITFRKIGTPATFVIFAVTAAVTDNTGWLEVACSYVAGSGALSNADVLAIGFDKVADKGADGVDGAVTLTTPQTLSGPKTLTSPIVNGGSVNDATINGPMYTRDDDGTISGGTWAIDYANGPVIKATAGANITSITMTNWPASGTEGHLSLRCVNFGAYTITFPAWNWIKSDLTTTTTFADLLLTLPSSGTAFIDLRSDDGGTTITATVRRN